jgi:hypothetical protein
MTKTSRGTKQLVKKWNNDNQLLQRELHQD